MCEVALSRSPSDDTDSVARVRPVRQVMVCDNDLAVRYAMKRLFMQELSADVVEAENGLAALKALRENRPDLLVLALHMPIMDGIETLEAIRSTPALQSLPVVVLTDDCDADTVRRVIALGVTDYVMKPLSKNGTWARLKGIVSGLQVKVPTQRDSRQRNTDPVLMAGHKLLVADGSDDFRHFIRSTFGSRFRIVEAANGIDALDVALSTRPHAVLIGRDLPQIKGDVVARKLRAMDIRPELLLISVASKHDVEAARDTGLYDVCVRRTFVPEVFAQEFDALGPASVPLAELLDMCPSLRAQITSASEQVFGMMLKMDVEPHDGVVAPFNPPYAAARITLDVADRFIAHIELIADLVTAQAFAMAMFGIPEATEALLELSNIVGGRVKHALVTEGISGVLGLPQVQLVTDGAPDVRGSQVIGVRFGVVASDYEFEVRLSASPRAVSGAARGTGATA